MWSTGCGGIKSDDPQMLILTIWGDWPVMKAVDEPRGSQILQVVSRANCLGLEIRLNRADNSVTIPGRQR